MQRTHANANKKRASKGRKPKVHSTNDFCRLCNCALKIKYGDFDKISYISTENLLGHSKGFEGKPTLQELCGELGFLLEKSPNESERVCKSCAQKIRNAHELYNFIKNNLKRTKDRATAIHLLQVDLKGNYLQVFARPIVVRK